ncbi:FMN-linked oxidoreductase [Cutaneotrichosporon oleaginosum]|uniref:FMN-linked oxidoreductase n=1 Tax=Cutaneotrichosporon oleaginosum TaxID=879819 RepID=A0A0J0XPE5_9TREE|nr:FMN-linked oxidoreductase [Cutaneotrichosporon oleaginosum]KLT42981.1 FMN-linked oxidoreductase [Cutaneotrichosporon oleaginosum]TXT11810.1 hypothetical protein COLE_02220 [Cutaneotrichosporon oleaginosum]
MSEDVAAAWADLPTPERLPVRTMLEEFETVNVLAPLVRCSKLPFRHLVSLYETHVTHTPMILAEEFSRSQQARVSDLTTSADERGVFWMEPRRRPPRVSDTDALDALAALRLADRDPDDGDDPRPPSYPAPTPVRVTKTLHAPRVTSRLPPSPTPPSPDARLVRGALVAQMASPNGASLADAAELLAPHVDGLDINCGCPQRWAYAEGIGCALLRRPELVADMVRCVHGRMGWDWPVSIKIRVDPDLRRTEQLVRTALAAGVSHVTVHGRTRHQASTEPVSLDKLAFAVECVRGEVPTVANGDLWDLADAQRMRAQCGVHGVMAARGLLANPALFAGYDRTPVHAVENFVNLGVDYGFIFSLFHRHLAYMLESHFVKPEKTYFNALSSSVQVVEYLQTRGLDFGARRKVPMWDARRGYSLF